MSGDGLLVVRCQLGEREAFRELVRVWHAPLWRYVRGMVGSPHLADDLSQEVWVAVVRGLPRLRQPERFAPWLFTIARRTVADHLRQAYQASETSVEEASALADDDSLRDVLTTMQVEAGLDELPPLEREVLILFHLQDLPLAACAEVLGVPPGTVKSRLHRARRMLRSALAEKGYEA
ncbi:RNA polymerase subunit sigma-24 [Microbispora sp. ATCC PTA-5024]|nr:RNA polymerase subunit sigma-24 [Microbispora sp. ATCC PTA-5024]